ncbi:MAG: TorF family putative porin [Burkholderiales bacterium]
MRILTVMSAVLLLTTGVANAQVSGTVTAVSDYDFRGVTQTAGDPALQGSIDYAHSSGWYIGAWTSNVDFGGSYGENMELDLYTGIAGAAENGIGWDVGLIDYTYPGTDVDADFFEIYASVSYKMFKGKFWYADDYFNLGESAYYIEGNATVPLPKDFSLLIHAGYSDGDYWSSDAYFDYSVGVSRSLGHFNLALKWIDGSDLEIANNAPDDVFTSDARVVFSVSTTFPWSSE